MNNTNQDNNYDTAWEFIMDNLPDYYHRDDVLYDDILCRFLEGEEVCDDDLEWIEQKFHSDKKVIAEELRQLETGFILESLKSYYKNVDS